jgi:hypothetical protein
MEGDFSSGEHCKQRGILLTITTFCFVETGKPPRLVKRCKGTTAWLGLLEVI